MIRLKKNYRDSRKDGNARESEIKISPWSKPHAAPYHGAHHIAQVIYDALPIKIFLGVLVQLNKEFPLKSQ